MSIFSKFKTVFRGQTALRDLAREAVRRRNATVRRKAERQNLKSYNDTPPRLVQPFASLSPDKLLAHFRDRNEPTFWPGDLRPGELAKLQSELFPTETDALIESANSIVHDSTWELAGLGPLVFKTENFWRQDPFSGKDWGTQYHADVVVYGDDGADIRVLWELNRFGHAITLARAFAVTGDEVFAETFFSHVESWMRQNPYGRGPNWNCAMEVALRAINLLAAFDILRRSRSCTEAMLMQMLQLFDRHGRFILYNNEFSYIATSNHYLSDVVGLFWIGTMLPELEMAQEWREFGLREMLGEMDKQILPDGADFESSTGYHKFVTEMLLYSFLLADRNGIEIDRKYRDKVEQMLMYIHAMMQPDGGVPLIGDADGSQIVPVTRRDADDQAYLLGIGAVVFDRPEFRTLASFTPEVLWVTGEKGVKAHRQLAISQHSTPSAAFPDAGAYIMRDGDLYLHFNTNDCGVSGRGSHGHNDALSIEISAFGRAFIIDPGSCAYNLDREARQTFRSTAYHSTVTIDGVEQNTIETDLPFVMGNEARPKVLSWETSAERDRVSAEHYGYLRLAEPIVHRRTIEFDKSEKYWSVEDKFEGKGQHEFSFSFHIAPALAIYEIEPAIMRIGDADGARLLIRSVTIAEKPEIAIASRSANYGHKEASQIIRWKDFASAPLTARFLIVPVAHGERMETGLALIRRLTQNIGN